MLYIKEGDEGGVKKMKYPGSVALSCECCFFHLAFNMSETLNT